MSNTKNKFYLTTPIYYVNARPHIGHAYTTIVADVIARRHRLLGNDTFFLTGTDEHGQKIERSAAAAGIPPQQFADQISASFRTLWDRMGITYNDYIRTTDPHHKQGVQKLFQLLRDRDAIYLSTYTGQYSVGEEMFIDGPPGTIGPDGKPTETVTEENYFFRLSDYQEKLINLIESNELSIQPEARKNEVLSFLRGNINQATAALSEAVILSEAKNPESLHPADTSQTVSATDIARSAAGNPYVPGALKDLSISRSSFKWGIPVPGDEKHVIYVWLDALANYMTAIGYGSEDPKEQEKFNRYWPADLHLVGKEIIRFHCVYWPAFLMAAGLPLPKAITAHGWLLFEESKMSKSRGNIVRTETILDAFGTLLPKPAEVVDAEAASAGTDGTGANSLVKGTASAVPKETADRAALAAEVRLTSKSAPTSSDTTNRTSGGSTGLQPGESDAQEKGALAPDLSPADATWKHEQDLFASDVLRYFLLREIPFGQDGSFSFDALVQRYNSDLANGYGNLVSRTLKMIEQYFGGAISLALHDLTYNSHTAAENAMLYGTIGFSPERLTAIERLLSEHTASEIAETTGFSSAFERVQDLIKWTDDILSVEKPWKERDTPELTHYVRTQVLYQAAESIRIITALLYPVLPYATAKVWKQLGFEKSLEQAAANAELKDLKWGGLQPGTKLGPLAPIFPRAPKELIQLMNDMEASNAQKAESLKSVKSSKTVVENVGLPHINNNTDASSHPSTEFRESPISSVSATANQNPIAETIHPIAPHHQETEARPETPQIAIDDFIKIDLRVAQIVIAERIPKADKLLRLEVDLGYEKRQILSGIAQWYTPEELVGRRIVVIANLAPRKMRGLESHGMLLAANHGEDGKPILATFAEDIALGSRLK